MRARTTSYLAELTLATRVRVLPFRRAQFRNLGRLAKSHAEHDRVVVAILRGDRERRGERDARAYRYGVGGVLGVREDGVGQPVTPIARSSPQDFPTARSGRARRRSTRTGRRTQLRSAPNRSTKMRWIAGMNDEPPVRNTWSIRRRRQAGIHQRLVDRFGDAVDIRRDPGLEFRARDRSPNVDARRVGSETRCWSCVDSAFLARETAR